MSLNKKLNILLILAGPTNEDETSYLTAADAEIVMETGEVLKLEPNHIHKALPKATTCN